MTAVLDWIFRRRKPAWTALERSLIAVAIADASSPHGWWRRR